MLQGFWLVDSYVMALWSEQDEPWIEKAGTGRLDGLPIYPGKFSDEELVDELPEELDPYEDHVEALLPMVDNRVATSHAELSSDCEFVRWRVPTANSIADCIIEWLLKEDVENVPMRWGCTMRYWQRLAEFASILVRRNCYAPAVVQLEQRHYATWKAVFTSVEERYWNSLEEAMPPVCLANYPDGEDDEGPINSQRIALSFLDACVDHLVRQRLLRENTQRMRKNKSSVPVHRQWLNALKGGRLAAIDGTERELDQFGTDVRAWNQYMRLPCLKTPFRLVFQLESPQKEQEDWLVHFALQAARDPNVLLHAQRIWSRDVTTNSTMIQAREMLLAGLGKSLEVFPKVQDSLTLPAPTQVRLDKFEAIEFMTKTALQLRRRGFHVILPTWWEDPHDSLQVTLRISPAGGDQANHLPALGVNQLVQYRWDVALGEEKLSDQDFQQLATSKEPLVHRQGKWYRLDGEALRKSIDLLEKKRQEGVTSLEKAMKVGLELEKTGIVPVIDFQGDGEPEEVLSRHDPDQKFEMLDPAEGFVGELRPYQQKGFSWLVFVRKLGFGACLADDMGLGKTIQMIAALLEDRDSDPDRLPSLIISPMSVVGNWLKEINRFGPQFKVMVHHGSDRVSNKQFVETAEQHDIVITTYALAVRDQACLLRCFWSHIILDEAQNIKNPNTKQALAIRSLRSKHRFCLTGTPIENRLTELWSIMEFLNPGYLGKLNAFRSNFSVPIERDKDISRADVLQKIIRPFVLRRLKSDGDIIRDLPEKQEMKVFCNLTSEQAALYQAVVDDMLTHIETQTGIARRGLVLSALTKLKQVTNHPAHFLREGANLKEERSGKLQRLMEMLEVILEEKDRALVFTQFTEFGDMLWKKLQRHFGVEVLYLHGGTPKAKREEMVNRFQEHNGPPIFLLSLKAGGVGLNLTAACHVFHFDRWWNPAVEDQATDRAFRIGQTRNVQVHKFVCIGTVEERIDQMLDEKKRLADVIVTPGEQMLTELSTDELRHIFSLTHDAVVE